jgi:PAS domain S-box-containing protein
MTSEPPDGAQIQLHYRELAEHLPDSAVYIFDADLRVVFAGGSLMAKSRWSRDALVGKALADLMPPTAFAQAEPHLRATLAGEDQSYELTYPTGESFDVRSAPIVGEDGSPHSILVVALDITARKHAQLALGEAERFARATLDGLSAHIAIVAADGTIVAVNRAWRQFAAANPPADLPAAGSVSTVCEGVNYAAVCRAAAAAGCTAAQQWLDGVRAVLAGETELIEFEYACHSPGERRWFVTRISRLPQAGTPYLVVAHENITQHKLHAMALYESEARYRALFEDNHTIIVLVERAGGTIVDANPAAAAYYGYSRAQMRGMNVFDFHVPPPAEVWAEIAQAEAEGRHFYRFKQRRADGAVRDLEAYSSPVELNGRQLRYAIMHDVTERNAAGQALQRSEAALKRSQQVAHIGHWTWDLRSNTMIWSDEAKRIFGLDPAHEYADLNQVIAQAIHPGDAERCVFKAAPS